VRVLYLRALSLTAILTCVQCASAPPKPSCESELPSDRKALIDKVQSAAKADQAIWDSYWACNSLDAGIAIDAIGQKHKADLIAKELDYNKESEYSCEISQLETTFTDPMRPPACRVSRKDICGAKSLPPTTTFTDPMRPPACRVSRKDIFGAKAVPPTTVSIARRQRLADRFTECVHQGSWWTAEHLISANQVDRVIQELRFEDHITWSEISGTCKDLHKTCYLLTKEDCDCAPKDCPP
jgi:hypothetical protein